jgi:hypothetical protein
VGLTLIRKSDAGVRKRNPRIAVVLAGGAMSGGAFKVGGLKALDDFFVDRRITDLDIYVGLSAGSILAASLASGITPDEMIGVLDGSSERFDQLRPVDFYNPNFREFAARPAKFLYDLFTYLPSVGIDLARGIPGLPEAVGPAVGRFLQEPTYTRFELMIMHLLEHVSPKREVPALTNHVPSGFFDNATSAPSSASAGGGSTSAPATWTRRSAPSSERTRTARSPSPRPCRPRRRCRSSTSRRASTAWITWTAAFDTRRTSTSRSRRGRT